MLHCSGTLVFHHNGIGDYVMSLPALRLLTALAPPPVHLVHGDVAASFLYDELSASCRTAVAVGPGRFAHQIGVNAVCFTRRYEFFISLATWDSPEVSMLASKACAQVEVGFFSWCSLRLENQPRHDLWRMFALASAFAPGARLADFSYPLRFGGRKRRSPTAAGRLLVVHGDTRADKMWPTDRYDRLLSQFLRHNRDWQAAVLNFPESQVPHAIATGRVELLRGVALSEAMRVVAEADLFLGIDSCMLHVADLCRVPGVALFGPTRAEQFGYCVAPRAQTHNLQARGPIERLSVVEVLDALQSVRKRIES
jgi:ADP-heptose:LPS heptosyltransferase